MYAMKPEASYVRVNINHIAMVLKVKRHQL